MTAGMGLRTLSQAIVFLIMAHVLGIESYGAYSAVLALACSLGGFVGFGASVLMLRDTAREVDVFSVAWGRVLATIGLTFPFMLAVYLLLSWVILSEKIYWSVIVCIGLAELLFTPLVEAAIQAYQGHERVGRAAWLLLATVLPRLVVALMFLPLSLLINTNVRLQIWALLYTVTTVVAAIIAMNFVCRDLGARLRPAWSGVGLALREGWPFAAGRAAQKIYVDIDKVMLARLATLEVTGAYSAAYRVIDMAMVPLYSLSVAAASRFFRAGVDGTSGAARYGLHVLPLPLAYALGSGVLLYVLASVLPWILGASFDPAVEVLHWLAWLPLIMVPRRFLQTALNASGRQLSVVTTQSLGALLNILLNLWAIPRWSWQGAVAATYVAELAISGMLLTQIIGWQRMRGVKLREKKSS